MKELLYTALVWFGGAVSLLLALAFGFWEWPPWGAVRFLAVLATFGTLVTYLNYKLENW